MKISLRDDSGGRLLGKVLTELEGQLLESKLYREVEYVTISTVWERKTAHQVKIPDRPMAVASYPRTGPVDGHFCFITLLAPDCPAFPMFTIKTFRGWDAVCRIANFCAEVFGA